MKVAICQPTYLPWLGYFDLMDQVDTFVLLDSVQFEKQSWQQRNRIKTPTGLQWLTVPVVFRGRLGQKIDEVEIRDSEFWRNHARAIELNYARAPFFENYFPGLMEIFRSVGHNVRLVDLNLQLIQWLMRWLGVTTPLVRSSSLNRQGKRSELLASICAAMDATSYLSPIGSAEYLLREVNAFEAQNIEVSFHHYQHPQYRQQFGAFIPYASVLDLLFNEGERSMEIIRSGRGIPFSVEQVAAQVAEAQKA
jgi:WbqC-like protein